MGVQRPYEVKCGILAGLKYHDRLVCKVHHIKKHNFIRQVRLLPVKWPDNSLYPLISLMDHAILLKTKKKKFWCVSITIARQLVIRKSHQKCFIQNDWIKSCALMFLKNWAKGPGSNQRPIQKSTPVLSERPFWLKGWTIFSSERPAQIWFSWPWRNDQKAFHRK